MSSLLERDRAALLVIDVQERINSVMADQGHLPRIEVLVEACRGLEVPVVASEQYPQGLGPTVES
ncbi:MAG: isochorismatase family protein, partial [Acidobacteria bacterium]|nr:isochorismatase family protein [Acidobacteriota bacterium]